MADRLAPGQPIAILASDHQVTDHARFQADFARSAAAAEDGHMVLHGISATAPHTRFGYVLPERDGVAAGDASLRVSQFIEKPDEATAMALQLRGAYWNSGNVVVLPQVLLAAARHSVPEVVDAVVDAVGNGTIREDHRGDVLEMASFALDCWVPLPLDRAVLERTHDMRVMPAGYDWSDLGTWDAIRALQGAESDFVHSSSLPVVVLGLEGVIVVATDAGILVTREGQSAHMGPAVAAALARKP